MFSLLSLWVFLVLFGALALRWTATTAAFLFILLSFLSRILAGAYIDVAGPVFAEELFADIGSGNSTPLLLLCLLLIVLPVAWVLSPRRLARMLPQRHSLSKPRFAKAMADLVFWLSLAFTLALFFQLLSGGVIPLFQQIERYDFNRDAGALHGVLLEHGNIFALLIGGLCVYPRLHGGRIDWRFCLILLLWLSYFFLTGHRFSPFYSLGSFFLMPFSLVIVQRRIRISPIALLAAMSIFAMVGYALFNSYTEVRGFEGDTLLFKLEQRILVQPTELWWVTYERVVVNGQWDGLSAAHFLFVAPFEAARNTTIQYLMMQALDLNYAWNLIQGGFQYAGGYPEILFELFGFPGALPVIFLIGLATAGILHILLSSLARGYFVSFLFASYVYYALTILYIGGMLNFLVAWTFWVKIVGLMLAMLLEPRFHRANIISVDSDSTSSKTSPVPCR